MCLWLIFKSKISSIFTVFYGISRPVNQNCCTRKWIASGFQGVRVSYVIFGALAAHNLTARPSVALRQSVTAVSQNDAPKHYLRHHATFIILNGIENWSSIGPILVTKSNTENGGVNSSIPFYLSIPVHHSRTLLYKNTGQVDFLKNKKP